MPAPASRANLTLLIIPVKNHSHLKNRQNLRSVAALAGANLINKQQYGTLLIFLHQVKQNLFVCIRYNFRRIGLYKM